MSRNTSKLITILTVVAAILTLATMAGGIIMTTYANYDDPSKHGAPDVILDNLDTAKKLGPVLIGVGFVGFILSMYYMLRKSREGHKHLDSSISQVSDQSTGTDSQDSGKSTSKFGFRFY